MEHKVNYIKSLNAPAKENNYSKNNSVWNESALVNNKRCVISEGLFNSLMVEHKGIASIATYGKKITDEQIDLILSYNPTSIVLFLDTDARQEQWELAHRIIAKGFSPDKVFMVNNPDYFKDANDLGRKGTWKLLKQATLFTDKFQFGNMVNFYLKGVKH